MTDKTTLGQQQNVVDRLMGWLDPGWGLRRLAQRQALLHASAIQSKAHEAASPSRNRKFHKDNLSPNAIVGQGAQAIRTQTRHLDRNNDIARGIIRTMVNNIVGPAGIGVEPQPRKKDGTIHEDYARQLRDGWRLFCKLPEVQRRFSCGKSQRMMAKAWIRDGEAFTQDLIGTIPGLVHSTAVPYSLELFEADFLPLDYTDLSKSIVQGIERNAWGAARAYWVYKGDPRETLSPINLSRDLKRIEAARVRHLAFLDHIGQSRGISEFASIIARLEDIKDYEESERIAAKVAAMLTAYVKRAPGQEGYDDSNVQKDENGKPIGRQLSMSPGMIIDGLAIGEEIGLIDSKRPNPNVVTFRQGQLRAAAAGVGASYSSIAKAYDGTFSAQRQELVEQWVNYAVLSDDFTGQWVQPTYETFVSVANISGVIKTPRDVVPESADDALFIAQAMPWIDPMKEAQAWILLARAGFASEIEIMRKRGVNPRDMLEQIKRWREETKGLVFTSNAANGATTSAPDGSAASSSAQGDGGQAAAGAEP